MAIPLINQTDYLNVQITEISSTSTQPAILYASGEKMDISNKLRSENSDKIVILKDYFN